MSVSKSQRNTQRNKACRRAETEEFDVKARGIQNREFLMRRKAKDALNRQEKELKKSKRVAVKDKLARIEAKKNVAATKVEDFMPKIRNNDDAYANYMMTMLNRLNEPTAKIAKELNEPITSEEEEEEDIDCVVLPNETVADDGWALL